MLNADTRFPSLRLCLTALLVGANPDSTHYADEEELLECCERNEWQRIDKHLLLEIDCVSGVLPPLAPLPINCLQLHPFSIPDSDE